MEGYKKCLTCEYWGGNSSLYHVYRGCDFNSFSQNRGKCHCKDSQLYASGEHLTANNSCNYWEKHSCMLTEEEMRKEAQERVEREAKEKAEREAKEKAEREAAEKLRKAAEQGDAEAQYKLGLLYMEGKGVPCDYSKANELINKAAAQNYVEAKNYLARKEAAEKIEKLKRIGHFFALVLQIIGIVFLSISAFLGGTNGDTIVAFIIITILTIIPFLVLFFASSIVKRIVLFILGIPLPLFFHIMLKEETSTQVLFSILYGIVILVSNTIALICPKED
jgi:hypothetical protein